jgi:outer membrane lipoprotein-sorting protein
LAKLRKGEEYEIKLMFKKPGLYYINLYRDFKEETVKGEFTSKGKMQACGIVIVAK